MSELFAAVRKRSPPRAWSEGVTLARRGAVSIVSADDEEIVARVEVPGSAVSPKVSLYPEDGEWECDCDSPLEACEHVAALVIARRQGVEATRERRPILYRLRTVAEGLFFERGVAEGESFHPIEFPLEAVAGGRFRGPRFEAGPRDLEVEKVLGGTLRGVVVRQRVPELLEALARVEEVILDGERVRASPEPVVPPVRLDDAEGGGFRLSLGDGPAAPASGFVRLGDVLHPQAPPELTGREREELARGRLYRAEEVELLVGEVLPSLRKRRVPVEIRTDRLPAATRMAPRVALTTRREDDRLYVLPRIVYGDPPVARVEGDRLVALGARSEVPLRDLSSERALEERLSRELGLPMERGVELETEDALELVGKLGGSDVRWEGRDHEAFRRYPTLEPGVRLESERFEVSFETDGGKGAEPSAVLSAWREGRSLVPLVGGGYAPLPENWLEEHGEILADLLAARRTDGSLGKASLPDLARLAEALQAPPPPGFEALRAAVEDFESLSEAPIAPELRARLRDYQRQGVDWLWFLEETALGGLLADDMGLGKTLQALSVLEGRCLVVAPTSVLRNWVEEARRFRPELRVSVYHGRGRSLDEGAELTVTSHAVLRLDREVLAEVPWDAVVVDEAQAMRNPETELARAACSLSAKFRVSLTGTPVENRLLDLWSHFHFLTPGLLGSREDFEERYVRPVERGDPQTLERLRERIRPFFLRRLKSEVAPELPPRTEVTLHVELDEAERRLYDSLKLAARKDVLAKLETGAAPLAVLEALLRLRQAACHPGLVPGRTETRSSKAEVLLDALDTVAAEGGKALVFSQWTSMLDLLEAPLRESSIAFTRLDGSTRDRTAVVERFQSDPAIGVFLVSLKAGGVGLNLTAADHVFLVDPWWNPAVEEQAFDRAHRIGQDKPVFVYRLVADDTVEERILALQEDKRSLAALATGIGPGSLTRDDLLRLLD